MNKYIVTFGENQNNVMPDGFITDSTSFIEVITRSGLETTENKILDVFGINYDSVIPKTKFEQEYIPLLTSLSKEYKINSYNLDEIIW